MPHMANSPRLGDEMTLTFKVNLKDNIQQHMRHLGVATPF